MKVYKDIEEFKPVANAVVTTGTFDGLHNGHRVLITRVKQLAAETGGQSVVVTFHPHPQLVLHPNEKYLYILNTQEEKIKLFKDYKIDHLIFVSFTPEFAKLSYTDFIKNILVDKLQVRKLVIGFDHHFGKDREGQLQHLVEYGNQYNFDVEQISAQKIGDVKVSSTKIRKALLLGAILSANKFLGYKYLISGRVVKGDGIGRTLGFPTANLEINDPHKLVPANGVYVVEVEVKKKRYGGMLNIGTRPTFDGVKLVIEVHIFDFDENIYYETLTLYFFERLRNEVKFENTAKLKEQLVKDKENSLKLLTKNKDFFLEG